MDAYFISWVQYSVIYLTTQIVPVWATGRSCSWLLCPFDAPRLLPTFYTRNGNAEVGRR